MPEESKLPAYVPYKKDDRPGSNDIRENSGPGSTAAYRPHGWENFEENTNTEEK
jgi:hypothetical protein